MKALPVAGAVPAGHIFHIVEILQHGMIAGTRRELHEEINIAKEMRFEPLTTEVRSTSE
jgi:hypothetical protein